VRNIIADGSKESNDFHNGCVGGAIYFKNAKRITIQNCVARNWNGDAISFQIDEDVHVVGCKIYDNTGIGLHPGTGSERMIIRGNDSYNNGQDGLFLCWRVRNGLIEDNDLHHNGRHGISIGHKDTDNVFSGNMSRNNKAAGIYMRRETEPQGGHRNEFYRNIITDNGSDKGGWGFLIEGETHDLVIEENKIGDTGKKVQKTGIRIDKTAWNITARNNKITGHAKAIEDESEKGGNVLEPNEISKEAVKY